MARIFDTFLFSEPYEAELLLAKLNIESPGIEKWIVVENSYTFQGEYKGNFLADILKKDSRFSPFLSRLIVISADVKFPAIDPNKDPDEQGLYAEYTQRELARTKIHELVEEDDWVIVSDTDEIVDFSNERRHKLLLSRMNLCRSGFMAMPRIRFWYDYDNRWNERRSTPIVKAKQLQASPQLLGSYRAQTITFPTKWREEIVFEYSFCFSREAIIRKYDTFTHPGFDVNEINKSIDCNRVPLVARRRVQLDLDSKFWLRKEVPSQFNSPDYIRQHLEKLKTNVVPVNYHENRIREYPAIFSWKNRVRFAWKSMGFSRWRAWLKQFFRGRKQW